MNPPITYRGWRLQWKWLWDQREGEYIYTVECKKGDALLLIKGVTPDDTFYHSESEEEIYLKALKQIDEAERISESEKQDACDDDRFQIIEAAKQQLLAQTNIETSPDEMKVLDTFLFRMWQMGWLPGCNKGV